MGVDGRNQGQLLHLLRQVRAKLTKAYRIPGTKSSIKKGTKGKVQVVQHDDRRVPTAFMVKFEGLVPLEIPAKYIQIV
jgi:hypothetical protein